MISKELRKLREIPHCLNYQMQMRSTGLLLYHQHLIVLQHRNDSTNFYKTSERRMRISLVLSARMHLRLWRIFATCMHLGVNLRKTFLEGAKNMTWHDMTWQCQILLLVTQRVLRHKTSVKWTQWYTSFWKAWSARIWMWNPNLSGIENTWEHFIWWNCVLSAMHEDVTRASSWQQIFCHYMQCWKDPFPSGSCTRISFVHMKRCG